MPLSMYDVSVPVLVRTLDNLQHVLRKGEAHAAEKNYSADILLQSRLAPDMFPLLRQVQIATDMARNAVARLAGSEIVSIADDETSFAQLHERIAHVDAYLRGFEREQFEDSQTRTVTLKVRGSELQFTGSDYLLHFVLPNVFFHCTTCYAILRHNGVALGKMDYLGAVK